jgi:hypothetical protein
LKKVFAKYTKENGKLLFPREKVTREVHIGDEVALLSEMIIRVQMKNSGVRQKMNEWGKC